MISEESKEVLGLGEGKWKFGGRSRGKKNKLCTNGDEEGRNGCTLIIGWGVGRRVRIGNIGGMCHGILSKLVMTGGCWS